MFPLTPIVRRMNMTRFFVRLYQEQN